MSESLPDEVFFEILLRLPVKAIIRSRCVSKAWCSLICSPNFMATHLNRSLSNPKNPPYLLFRYFDYKLKKARLTLHSSDVPLSSNSFTELRSSHQNFDKLCIVAGSSNGLLCLANDFWGVKSGPYVLWNPYIQKAITLPDPNVGIRSCDSYFTSLGFGYVPKIDDYKLVRLVLPCDEIRDAGYQIAHWVQIYTLRSHAWRTVGVHGPLYHMKSGVSAAFLHGAVHWPAYIGLHVGERRHMIVLFDLAEEAFHEVGMPEGLQKQAYHSDVAVLDGLLALVRHEPSNSKTVWVMKEYGVVESWTKLFVIEMPRHKMFALSRVIGYRETSEVLLKLYTHLFSSKPSSQRFDFLPFEGPKHSFFLDNYVESLVLLNVPNTGDV